MSFASIGRLAQMLGVAVITLRRWHVSGVLELACRTAGGHRRYDVEAAKDKLGCAPAPERTTVAYARVSSRDQCEHLKAQAERLQRHCEASGYPNIEVITDLGSAMNYRKKGLQKLLLAILRQQVGRVVLVTKDRLLRLGSELLFAICRHFSVEVVVLDADPTCSREQQLTERPG